MMPVIVPVGIHRSAGIDGADLCSGPQCDFSKPSRSAPHFENFLPRKGLRPIGLAEKTLFRKPHAVNGVKLSPGVFIPFKTKRRGNITCQYKSGDEVSYFESVLSSPTNQKCFFNPILLFFRNPF